MIFPSRPVVPLAAAVDTERRSTLTRRRRPSGANSSHPRSSWCVYCCTLLLFARRSATFAAHATKVVDPDSRTDLCGPACTNERTRTYIHTPFRFMYTGATQRGHGGARCRQVLQFLPKNRVLRVPSVPVPTLQRRVQVPGLGLGAWRAFVQAVMVSSAWWWWSYGWGGCRGGACVCVCVCWSSPRG